MQQIHKIAIIVLSATISVAGCGSEPRMEIEFDIVPFEYSPQFIGPGDKVVTLGAEQIMGEDQAGRIRAPSLVDSFDFAMVVDPTGERVLAVDIRIPLVKTSYRFAVEETAAGYVMLNPFFWGWSAEYQGELYAHIYADPDFPWLVARIAASLEAERAFFADEQVIATSLTIAERVAQQFSEALIAAAGDERPAPKAILQPIQPMPRFVTIDHPDPADQRVIRLRNRGLLAERIFCFERGRFDNTLAYLGSNGRDTACNGNTHLGGPQALFGFIPVSSIPILDVLVGGPVETELRLDAEEGEYEVYDIIPCAACAVGVPWVDNPLFENTTSILADILGFVLGSRITADKLSSGQKVAMEALYSQLWLASPSAMVSAARSASAGDWTEAFITMMNAIRDNANAIRTLLGMGSVEEDLLVFLLDRLTPLAAPTVQATAQRVTTAGTAVYIAARVVAFLWVAGKEWFGDRWDRALVATGTPRMDIVFVLDSSSSMVDILTAAKARVAEIAAGISAHFPDARFGLADFRDFPVPPYGEPEDWPFLLRSELTSDVSELEDALGDVATGGGGDWLESHLHALAHAASQFMWSEDAFPVVVLVSDAAGHDSAAQFEYPGPRFDDVARELLAGSIRVVGLAASSEAVGFMEQLASATNTYTPDGQPAVFSVNLSGSDLAEAIISSLSGLVDGTPAAPLESVTREAALSSLPLGRAN